MKGMCDLCDKKAVLDCPDCDLEVCEDHSRNGKCIYCTKEGIIINQEAVEFLIRMGMKEVTEDLEWKNIDHEIYRVYQFPDGNIIKIHKPVLINVSKSGGHRILDANNMSHYIPFKWIHLYWETDDNNAFRW